MPNRCFRADVREDCSARKKTYGTAQIHTNHLDQAHESDLSGRVACRRNYPGHPQIAAMRLCLTIPEEVITIWFSESATG